MILSDILVSYLIDEHYPVNIVSKLPGAFYIQRQQLRLLSYIKEQA